MNTYSIGNTVRLTATFRDADGELADPDEVIFNLLYPSGLQETSQPLTPDSVGVYHNDVITAESGIHVYKFSGTGTIDASEENSFRVRESAFSEPTNPPTPALRTVFIDSDENIQKVFAKDPNATLDYRFDWSGWLAGDEIVDAVWACSTGILLSGKEVSPTTCTAFVSGGKAGKTYLVRIRIETDDGRTNDQTIRIEVKDV